jgi:hypothetical protein
MTAHHARLLLSKVLCFMEAWVHGDCWRIVKHPGIHEIHGATQVQAVLYIASCPWLVLCMRPQANPIQGQFLYRIL